MIKSQFLRFYCCFQSSIRDILPLDLWIEWLLNASNLEFKISVWAVLSYIIKHRSIIPRSWMEFTQQSKWSPWPSWQALSRRHATRNCKCCQSWLPCFATIRVCTFFMHVMLFLSLPENMSTMSSWLPQDLIGNVLETCKLTLQFSHHWQPDKVNANLLSIIRTIVALLHTQGKELSNLMLGEVWTLHFDFSVVEICLHKGCTAQVECSVRN